MIRAAVASGLAVALVATAERQLAPLTPGLAQRNKGKPSGW